MEAVRTATREDLPRLAALLSASIVASDEVGRAASLFRHPHRLDLIETRLLRALDGADRCLLSGTIDHYVAGMALISLDQSVSHGAVGVIEELFVEPEAREIGLGSGLLDAAVSWCREQHCVGIDIAALPGDREAKNLCERAGFVARTLVMHRRL